MQCKRCGRPFPKPLKGIQRFCSAECCKADYYADKRGLRTKYKLKCVNCNKSFTRQWPNTRQDCCSGKCTKVVYREKNRKELSARSAKWAQENRARRLEIQRKWNNSPHGRAYKKQWFDERISEKCRLFLERYHKDKGLRMVMLTRAQSRKVLVRSGRKQICERCGSNGRLHCHHLDHDPFNRELTNLQWLCPTCHGFVHSEAFPGK